MSKKPRSPKQLANDKKLGEAARAKKQNAEDQNIQATPPPAESQKRTIEVDAELLQTLISKVEELEKQKNPNMTPEAALTYTAQVQGFNTNLGANGVQGRIFKYPVEKSYYPDPTGRLYDEPRLKRYNLRDNFIFDWEVEGVEYEKYGVTYAEPRFTVRLFRKMFEDDGVTETGQLALVNRAIMHEDEVVARAAADKLGIAEKFETFQDMMSEIRYYRFRTWLLDLFTPVQVEQHKGRPNQMVIDGKVVEMYDTEVLIEKGAAESKSAEVERQVRI